ncbi:MAG: potassium-transporting ATPase subunit KdpA [Bacteriovorax sp.]|nr:potassium-transporting ATPase subunit KdpA [Bacteriovorax sp.]
MNGFDVIQIFFVFFILILLSPILGAFFNKSLNGNTTLFSRIAGPFEKLVYRASGINENEEMNWKQYLKAVLAFNGVGFLFVFFVLLFQSRFPLNPAGLPNLSWHLAFNTAVSFMTNTNWQSYAGESTMSHFSQMVALAGQNFFSAATGISVLLVLIRAFKNNQSQKLGNFWVDINRSIVYILLPLSLVWAILLSSQGVLQNLSGPVTVKTLEGKEQIISQGPVASQMAIKQLGTNGGGFFNANSAHPYENPTPLSNFLELLALLLIPAALTLTFGYMLNKPKEGWILFSAMMIILVLGLSASLWSEYHVNSLTANILPMEGKEVRLGVTNSILWSTFTTAASSGSVNAMHSSLTPIAGGIALLNILFGEIIFGGVGSGLYGMLLYVVLTVFIAGLMVGRTPEYLGKKIEAFDIKMAIVGILAPSFVILFATTYSLITPSIMSSLMHKGPHGFSEIFYAFSSAAGNNGSAFAGLNANTPILNTLLAFAMVIGRFGVIFPVLALAGNISKKKIMPESVGTFKTDNFLFVFLLVGVILIVGALTFFPALSLGPIIEQIMFIQGKTF